MNYYIFTCMFYEYNPMNIYIKAKTLDEAKRICIKVLLHKKIYDDLSYYNYVVLAEDLFITNEMMNERISNEKYNELNWRNL